MICCTLLCICNVALLFSVNDSNNSTKYDTKSAEYMPSVLWYRKIIRDFLDSMHNNAHNGVSDSIITQAITNSTPQLDEHHHLHKVSQSYTMVC